MTDQSWRYSLLDILLINLKINVSTMSEKDAYDIKSLIELEYLNYCIINRFHLVFAW